MTPSMKLLAFVLVAIPIQVQADDPKPEEIASNYLLKHWQKQAADGEALSYPLLMWEDFHGGEVGWFDGDGSIPYSTEGTRRSATRTICKIQQTLSDNEALVMVRLIYPIVENAKKETLYLFKGFDFSRYVDDQWFEEKHGAVVTGKHKYTTAIGGTNSVWIVERADFPAVPAHPAYVGVGMRTWKDTTGTFSVEAAFHELNKGNAVLVKTGGEVLTVPLKRLSEPDQTYIRKAIAEERRTKRKR